MAINSVLAPNQFVLEMLYAGQCFGSLLMFYTGIVAIWVWFPSFWVFKFDVILYFGILDCLLKYPMQFTLERSCAHVISEKLKNVTFFYPLRFGVRQKLISISIVPFSRLYILEQVMKIICIKVSLPVKIELQYVSVYPKDVERIRIHIE